MIYNICTIYIGSSNTYIISLSELINYHIKQVIYINLNLNSLNVCSQKYKLNHEKYFTIIKSIIFFQLSFSQVITFECNNTIMAVSWKEIVNNPNAYMDWDEDGDIDEEDALIYLYQAYECDNQIVDCEEYITIVYDCACLDNQEIIFWEEIDESNCEINQMCECVVINNDINWNNIDWEDSDWEDFNWDEVWSDYDLGNIIDWNNAPWDDIIDLDIDPEDLINYIQNMLLGQSFDWDNFVEMQGGVDECCINPEWIDPMAMCPTYI